MATGLSGKNNTRLSGSRGWMTAGTILLFLPAVLIRFIQPLQYPVINWDEGLWNACAKHTLLLGSPIAYNFGHIFLSPLHYAATLLLYWLFSPSLALSRWLSAVFGVGTIFFTYLLGKRFAGSRVAVMAALFCAYNSLTILTSRMAMLEQEVTFYMVVAIYLWFDPRPKMSWLSGFFIAASLLVKANALALLPALIVGQLFQKSGVSDQEPWSKRITLAQWRSLSLGLVLALLSYFGISRLNPHLFIETWSGHSVERIGIADATDQIMARSILEDMFGFLSVFRHHFPDLIALAAVGCIVAWIRKWRPALFLVAWFLFTFVLISAQTLRSVHYYYPLIPGIAILAALGLNEILAPRSTGGLRFKILVGVVAVMCAAQVMRFYPYYRGGLINNPVFFEAAAQAEKLVGREEPIISIGFTMLLVPNPTIPLYQFMRDRWEVYQHRQNTPSIPWPQYAILRNFGRAPYGGMGGFIREFIEENFVKIYSCKTDPAGNYAYIAEKKPADIPDQP